MRNVTCVLLGDGNVGKTSLLTSFIPNCIPVKCLPMLCDIYSVDVMIDGRPVNVNIWDTPDREGYDYHYAYPDVFLLVFSLIDRDSYTNVHEKWIGELRRSCPRARVVLVGTKADLRADNNVLSLGQGFISRAEGQALAKGIGAKYYYECSALTEEGVRTVFNELTRVALLGPSKLSKEMLSFNMAILDQLPAKLQLISRIQDSMDDLLKYVKICCTRSEYLVTTSQQQSSRILDWFSKQPANLYFLGSICHKWESVFVLLDRFICYMVAGEDLLSFCAKEDWKTVAFSLFLPASCDSTYSKFSLVTRDLDRTVDMLLNLLEAPTTIQSCGINETSKVKWSLGYIYQLFLGSRAQELQFENDSVEVIIKDELRRHANDLEHVLSKLESESCNPSLDLMIYGCLLRKRLQGDLLVGGASLVPDCFWIPGKLQYVYQDVAGSGSSKTVLKCTWLGQQVAIAVYKVAKLIFEREAEVLARVQHPNVVNFIGCAYEEKDQRGYLVTEFMEQNLRELIIKSLQGDGQMPFSLPISMDIILQIVEAMIHMRKCRVSHRDLKPENCLLSMKKSKLQEDLGDTYYVVKLIDFGSAKLHSLDTSICHTRKRGSTPYMAPEVHRMKDDCQYTWSTDVYSFGMTCYEIISGKYPFEGECSGVDLVKRVCAGERPQFSKSCPLFLKQLIEKCWHQNPKRRPTFESIRKEIWECYDKLV